MMVSVSFWNNCVWILKIFKKGIVFPMISMSYRVFFSKFKMLTNTQIFDAFSQPKKKKFPKLDKYH